MHEATFHIRGGVPYEEATRNRDITIELWCNNHCDLLHVKGHVTDEVQNEIAETVGIEHSSSSQPGIEETVEGDSEQVIITSQCLRPHTENNIESYLAEHDCLLLPPLRYERGGKVVRVITLDPENLTRFYQDIQESFRVEVHSKRKIDAISQDQPMLSVESLVPDLSERQQEAILMAWQAGYYEIPRETTTEELAGRMDIDRRTFEEHLRLAENKFIGALVNRLLNTRGPN
ncbi:helix-turn-helix domain-containing protein [Haloarcula halophila]|uniref:helix-turn-helix domain-containing protein n=1 Tax=Haloarcula halophila TaxID=3032584 RepID=UPI0023E45209|nr:helix-turn-helix domain-containing protein [Halomicroarcula sp. DFY41]